MKQVNPNANQTLANIANYVNFITAMLAVFSFAMLIATLGKAAAHPYLIDLALMSAVSIGVNAVVSYMAYRAYDYFVPAYEFKAVLTEDLAS